MRKFLVALSDLAEMFKPKRQQLAVVRLQINASIADTDRRVEALLARLKAHDTAHKG